MSKPVREDFLHYTVRSFLRGLSWTLLAGQYPNGSDDELPCLNITDPLLARDNSPDPRRHSHNKLVPDLIAFNRKVLLIVEMKPHYSSADEQKLLTLHGQRRADLLSALSQLRTFTTLRPLPALTDLVLAPCLTFSAASRYPHRTDFCYILVSDEGDCAFHGNAVLPHL